MTTLSTAVGASAASASVSGPAKGNTPEAGFQAAFDSAAASLPSPSGTAQPGKSDKGSKPAGKGEDASPAKHGDPSQAPDNLLSLLVAPAPSELASNSLPVQEAAGAPAVASADVTDPGHALPEAGMDRIASAAADLPAALSAQAKDGQPSAGTLPAVPFLPAVGSAQSKVPLTSQSPHPEAQADSPGAQSSHAISAKNAVQPAAVPAQPASAPKISDTASLRAAQLQAAADASISSAPAQALSQAAGAPSTVSAGAGAGKAARPGSGTPLLQTAPSFQKPEPAAHLSSGVLTQEHGNQQKSDSSPKKEDSAGPTAPATLPSVQGPAANTNEVMSSLAVPGIVPEATVAHGALSGPSIPGAPATAQAAAVHAPEVNASAAALPQINTARVLGSMQGTELRVGMHSQEFGAVSIATSVSPGGVAAQIALDHGDLGKALTAHLPGIEQKLGHALGMQARVEVLTAGGGAGQSGSGPREGTRQDRGFPSAPGPFAAREPLLAQTLPESGEQSISGLRLSVRA